MTQKERLTELLISNELRDTPEEAADEMQERADFLKPWAEKLADYLLDNGVIVLPVVVGNCLIPFEKSFNYGTLKAFKSNHDAINYVQEQSGSTIVFDCEEEKNE